MKIEDLKVGFWGYKKFSVYQYITHLEEQFSAKLLEKDEENRSLLEKERQRSQKLEEELKNLRKQYEVQRDEQLLVANTLMEARRYAERLKDVEPEDIRSGIKLFPERPKCLNTLSMTKAIRAM